jgi:hypothetical protein
MAKKPSEKSLKKMDKSMRKTCAKRGFSKERCDKYVYGGKRNAGWKPSTQKRSSGRGR